MSDPIREAADAARRGELVVFPTDTVYGIGTRPDYPASTELLFEAKRRSHDLDLPVLVAGAGTARNLGVFDRRAELLAGALWPGALTIVLPRAPASRGWNLGNDPDNIGLRVPHDPLALALLAAAGPLAVTSANRSGEPTPADCDGLRDAFGELVAVYLCREEPLVGTPSTVVELAEPEIRVLREGSVDVHTILRLLSA